MKRVLVTGFDDYQGAYNPTKLIIPEYAKRFESDRRWDGIAQIKFDVFPVQYKAVDDLLRKRFREYEPDIVIGIGLDPGQATNRDSLRLERYGANSLLDMTSGIPKGHPRLDEGEDIDKGQEFPSYWVHDPNTPVAPELVKANPLPSRGAVVWPHRKIVRRGANNELNWPVDLIVKRINDAGVLAYVSESAEDRYLCHAMPQLAENLGRAAPREVEVGFMHVPYIGKGKVTMREEQVFVGLDVAIEECIKELAA